MSDTGTIECRFYDEAQVKALGRFMSNLPKGGTSLSFLVQTDYGPNHGAATDLPRLPIPIEEMRDKGTFSMPPTGFSARPGTLFRVSICLEEGATYSHGDDHLSISGFPRSLDRDAIIEEFRANRKDLGVGPAHCGPLPPPSYETAVRQGATSPAVGR